MKKLTISKDLTLPVDVVTQTVGILARKRAGKSFTARRFSEQLFKTGEQVVIADPKGDWWGIRSSADGKTAGLPFIILGGEHADVPLEPTTQGGELVAKLVVEERVSVLLDMGQMRKNEMRTFMVAFLETMYRLKAQDKFRTPMMFVMDEADLFCPQKPMQDEARMLGAVDDIVRRGGQRGIGCTFVSQRSAVINKNILSQLQVLITLRTIAPQDLKALDAWIENHGTLEQRKVLMESLPALPIGTAWVWSPGWPDDKGIFQRVKILPIETFDSGATPMAGQKQIMPKTMADIDLTALRKQMAEVVTKVAQDNPVALRKRISELEKHKCPTVQQNPVKMKTITVPAVGKRTLKGLQETQGKFGKLIKALREYVEVADKQFNKFSKELEKIANPVMISGKEIVIPKMPSGSIYPTTPPKPKPYIAPRPELKPADEVVPGTPSAAQQKILNTLLWMDSMGLAPGDKTQIAIMAGQRPTSGGYKNNLGSLRTMGLIDYPTPGMVAITEQGKPYAQITDVPQTTEQLHQQLFSTLPTGQGKILRVLIDLYPNDIPKDELAMQSEQQATSGGYKNNLGRLRSLKLIDYPKPGYVVAKPALFL